MEFGWITDWCRITSGSLDPEIVHIFKEMKMHSACAYLIDDDDDLRVFRV